jgi:D-sorbitol dehydrogenase-like protein
VPTGSALTTQHERGRGLTRRRFLLVACSSLVTASCAVPRERAGADGRGLDRFMRMSSVLTEVSDLDRALGRDYFEAFVRDGRAPELADFWNAAGFDTSRPPSSVADLDARGVYRQPPLAALAATVTRSWYSGIFVARNGEQRVITYVDALAWRTLGYRSSGPNTCGGAFGHWAEKPTGA